MQSIQNERTILPQILRFHSIKILFNLYFYILLYV